MTKVATLSTMKCNS